ncbi:hypothetical protein IHC87_06760 [Photobacterium damselae subsp. damselae]|uniref:hypothetical protein n=1 Tax=Photobacterium damselae TaxID=38293 RepID=UPI001F43FCC9|nr:hypothetical protein [Photobacterium damselae]UJZ95040.1 hypothetical protein IHC87_06760 [Photobacterium damselae subsp. damselae]UJZ99021.1 hypothetical protein IHC88_06750 [Photobacterium damselae subsp. damselae]
MIALDKLQAAMHARLNAKSIMEPSNAMASRHIRIKPNNITLTPLSKTSADIRYMPYECLLDVVISYRLRGGNVDNLMTDTAMTESLLLTELLTQGTVTIKGVAQEVNDLEILQRQHPDWKLMIVGDALLFDASRVGNDFGNMSDEMDTVEDEMFVYEDQWKAKMALTVHRYFPNPLLKTIVFSNDGISEDICIER